MTSTLDIDVLRSDLVHLSSRGRLAFILSCAERLLPNYSAFVALHTWGEALKLRQALDLAWRHMFGEHVDINEVSTLLAYCDAATPNTEDFESELVSPALDAANCCSLVLQSMIQDDVEQALEAATLARETVMMYVQEIESMPPQDPNLTEKISQHPLVQQELERQRSDLNLLLKLDLSPQAAHVLAARWRNPLESNIGLRSTFA